jgi:hypothetical protein
MIRLRRTSSHAKETHLTLTPPLFSFFNIDRCNTLPIVAIKKPRLNLGLSRVIRLRRTRSEFECEEKSV